tara:strand:+ start:772 stop:1827 length:1056 start_codon:yes stop_codon:yes gene_type:complete
MKKILITGTAGFIGFHLVKKLSSKNIKIFGIDNINNYYDVNLKLSRLRESGINLTSENESQLIQSSKYPNYFFKKIDLLDKSNLNSLFEKTKFDYVVNLAAQAGVRYSISNPEAYIESNILGFMNIIELCRNYDIKHLLYASSSSVYGMNEQIPFKTSSNTDHPVSLYAATKKSNELIAHSYSSLYNIPTTGLRFFTVYGPWGRPDMALFLFTEAAINGKPIKVFNNGNMMRDFTYIDDIVEGVSKILFKVPSKNNLWDPNNPNSSFSSAPYKIYNIGNNSPVNLNDFIMCIESELNIKISKNYMPIQPGDVEKTYADVGNLVKEIEFKPRTSVKNGVREFIKWYKNFYRL